NTPKGARALSRMKGTVLVGASKMKVTLDFSGEDLVVEVGAQGKADVRVLGSMDALLGVSLGKGMVWPVLTRRLKVGGKVWRLLRMLPLLKAEGA
ncbi:SCP2 sterol-binding domain-containing protein, partial [Myxococcota bacterium]